MKKLKLDPYLKPYPKPYGKVNCSWIQDLNVNNTLKFLEEIHSIVNQLYFNLKNTFKTFCYRLKKEFQKKLIVGNCLYDIMVEKDFLRDIKSPNHKTKELTTFV